MKKISRQEQKNGYIQRSEMIPCVFSEWQWKSLFFMHKLIKPDIIARAELCDLLLFLLKARLRGKI